jgi:hypothetical protein
MKGFIFAIERIGDNRAEGPLLVHGPLDQFDRDLRLGAKGGVRRALGKPVLRCVRLNLKRILDPLVGPQGGNGDNTIVGFAKISQILAPHVRGFGAVFAVACLINNEDTAIIGRARRLRAQQVQALRVDVPGLPRGLGQKPVQALGMRMLGATDRFGVGKRGEGRIAFGGQEQALQIATEDVTLIAFRKERVNVSSVRFEGSRNWCNRESCTHTILHLLV